MGRINVTSVFLWGESPNDKEALSPRTHTRLERSTQSKVDEMSKGSLTDFGGPAMSSALFRRLRHRAHYLL